MSKTWQALALCALLAFIFMLNLGSSPSINTKPLLSNKIVLEAKTKAPKAKPASVGLDAATKLIEAKEKLDLAEEDAEFERTGKPRRIRVCTIALNPRQGSLFRTNYLGDMGSGKYKYLPQTKCAWEAPRVRLISYVKCCNTPTKVKKSINAANDEFDIIIITGDEYCHINDPRVHFRQYHGTKSMHLSKHIPTNDYIENFDAKMMNSNQYPMYIPLGPREEFLFERITEFSESAQRKYVYNFLGSMTSPSRTVLRTVVGTDLSTPENSKRFPNFLHITDKWHLTVTKSNGYIEPDQYKQVLLDSVFTLCPTGHNPEAYRIYEALEAGSIPILAIDSWYRKARCNEAFQPYYEADAPFVYLNDGWQGLEDFLKTKGSNSTWIAERQKLCVDWYRDWMKKTALRFEALLEHRYKMRMERGEGVKSVPMQEEEDDSENDERLAVLQSEEQEEEN